MSEPTPASTPSTSGHSAHKVVVRAYPKVIFYWMTWITSLVAALILKNSPEGHSHLGTIWFAVFAFNTLVIAFDFSEVVSMLLVAAVSAAVFAGLYFGYLDFLGEWVTSLRLDMDSDFYFAMFTLFSVIYFFVFIKTRFDYWEFRHNEVIHRRGLFADLKRYSTEDLRWFKEVPDVVERLLCGSGRMILTTPREAHPIVIQHVLGISRIDEKVADILGVKRVTMH